MAARARKTHPPKFDRLLSPGATKEQIECNALIARFDRAMIDAERKWGIDRLPGMVSETTAATWGRTMGNLNASIEHCVPGDVAACVQSALRGLEIMDAEATAAGATTADADVWEYELESDCGDAPFRFGIIADDRQWQALKAKRPDLEFYTMREVALALRERIRSPLVSAAKVAFPGAQVTNIRPTPPVDYANGGDEIPF